MLIQRAYRYRFYPTPDQADQLARSFGCARWIYNWGLKERSTAFYNNGQRVYYKDLAARLKGLKQDPETSWLSEVSSVVLQQSLRHLDTAFTKFFKKESDYPTFKSRRDNQSCSYMPNAFAFREGKLTLAKHETPLDICWSRPFPKGATPSSVTVTRTTGGKFYISLLTEEEVSPLPKVKGEVGVDLNTSEIVCSNGKRYATPLKLQVLEQRKRRYQRACRRKVAAAKVSMGLSRNAKLSKGVKLPVSNNLRKAYWKVGRVTEHAANVRKDWQHKLTTSIVRENQTIAMESLYVRGMTASAKGSADKPGSNVKAKSGLNRSVLNAGFGEIARQLEYKTVWAGRTVVKIDRWYPSSKRCSSCGYVLKSLSLSTRQWVCPDCGQSHDRDLNASINILMAGKAILAGADGLRIHEW
ncbi:MAG: RNA-guided endonuclease TnpB family protein [Ferrovum myxofaciens]|uniref:RNA-guided endonuclease InsQ/TnpB family protein n=1 Tax=Ferrovum myxofaciens TaxID=416213 RepID=UPI003EBDD162